jgi:hypothetical protein
MNAKQPVSLEDALWEQEWDTFQFIGCSPDTSLRYFVSNETVSDVNFLRVFIISNEGCGIGVGYRPAEYGIHTMPDLYEAIEIYLVGEGISKTS